MYSSSSLREISALEFYLFDGLSREEFYSLPRSPPRQVEGEATGRITLNLKTR